jgi:hypothetical protein
MPDVTQDLARALIFAHGDEAVAYAQQVAQNVMRLQMLDKVVEWRLVIDAIKDIQGDTLARQRRDRISN